MVYVDGEPLFAQWVSIAASAEPTTIDVRLAEGGACDGGSFAGVTRQDDRVRAEGVSCGRWLAAIPAERRGAVLVARCERDACGPLLEWRVEPAGAGSAPLPIPVKSGAWPAWATWALVGVGAAAAGTAAVIATGALESRPTETRFVAGGVRIESR